MLQIKYTAKARGGCLHQCNWGWGHVCFIWELDGANSPQEANAAAATELGVPVPGTTQHFGCKEQEKVKISFLFLCCMAEAARHVRGMKGWHIPSITTSGAATEERYSPCYQQVVL